MCHKGSVNTGQFRKLLCDSEISDKGGDSFGMNFDSSLVAGWKKRTLKVCPKLALKYTVI